MAYNLYPAVDENYEFPPEIKAALIRSLRIRNAGAPMTTDEKNALDTTDLDPGYYIYNISDQRFEVWRPDFNEWHVGLEAPGSIKEWPGDVIPRGWMKQNGRELNRNTYKALFDVIKTIYGAGNNSTTFNIPNRGGRVTLDVSASHHLGKQGGAESVKLTEAQMPKHGHSATTSDATHSHKHDGGTTTDGTHEHTYAAPHADPPTGATGQSGVYRHRIGATTTGGGHHGHFISTDTNDWTHSHTVSTDEKGGSDWHENMMPYHAANLLIKY